jgi:hypothetical protein
MRLFAVECKRPEVRSAFDGPKGQNRHFGRTVQANWDVHGADAAAHEDLGVLATACPGNDRKLARRDGPDPWQDDLTSVCVATQHQRHCESRRFDQSHGCVRQQDHIRGRTAEHVRDL